MDMFDPADDDRDNIRDNGAEDGRGGDDDDLYLCSLLSFNIRINSSFSSLLLILGVRNGCAVDARLVLYIFFLFVDVIC